jgi:hypothetical protein
VAGQNFIAAPAAGFAISGTITSGGSPLAGVSVTMSGTANATTTTDASGFYSFAGLANGNYTVTPSLGGFFFTPVSRAITLNSANVTGQNFIATPVAGFSISGSVRTRGFGAAPGAPVAGVTMTLSGAATASTLTDAGGNYSFTGLANGNYAVTPGLTGFTFSPASRALTINGGDVAGQNFTRN